MVFFIFMAVKLWTLLKVETLNDGPQGSDRNFKASVELKKSV